MTDTSANTSEGTRAATELYPERSGRFSTNGYPTVHIDGDVCGPQPRPDANRRYGGWNHEAMDD